MSKTLTIAGKTYVPSTVLAGRFSYTSDYLSKLAREGKIEATRVGRSWFIDETSLQKFVTTMHEQKSLHRASLREERVKERQVAETKQSVAKKVSKSVVRKVPVQLVSLPSATIALAQAVAVVMCGSLVGLLGFVALHGNVAPRTLGEASKSVLSDVATVLTLPVEADTQLAELDLSRLWDWLFRRTEVRVASDVEVVKSVPDVSPRSTEAPAESAAQALVMLDGDTPTTTVSDIRESFSDEVEVAFDGEDTGVITPVFRERSDESYRFLLVPVTPEGTR